MFKLNLIPFPPSMNQAYPTNRHTGGRFKSREYKLWERDLKVWALEYKTEVGYIKDKLHELIQEKQVIWIDTHFYFEKSSIITLKNKPKMNDTSNRIKILHDGLSELLGIDDSYFWHGTFTKNISKDFPYCEAHLKTVPMSLASF